MPCDMRLAIWWTFRIEITYLRGKALNVLLVIFRPSFGLPCAAAGSRFGISKAFAFSLIQCFTLYKQSLPFEAFAGPAPFKDDG